MALPIVGGVVAALVRSLIGGLAISLPTLIKRVAISLGIGMLFFYGLDQLLSHITELALGSFDGVPPLVANIIGILNIDTAFNIVLSAYSIKLTFRLVGGTVPVQRKLNF